MKSVERNLLILAVLTASIASGAEPAKTQEDSQRREVATAESTTLEPPRPQLSANTNTGPEVPMARETNGLAVPAAPIKATAPADNQPRNPLWIILAVLAVVAARFGLKRLLARSRPS